MHAKRSIRAVFGVCLLGLTTWLLVATGPAAGQVKGHTTAKVTVVNVTAGKPTELAFKLSKFSQLPAGTITFKVLNVGYAYHDFKVCTAPVATAAANTCVGKVTKLLKHGDSATLTIKVTKSGKYEYLCSVSGHAGAGMKGLFGVGVTVTPSASVAKAATTASTSSTSSSNSSSSISSSSQGGAGVAGECPAGMTIAQGAAAAGGDHDTDDDGAPTDSDGCI